MRHVGLVLLAALLWLPTSASAQTTDDDLARNFFNLGTAQYERGDYEAAVRSFEEAYRLSHRAALLYNLYVAHERVGNLEDAARHLEAYLASNEPIENRAALESRLTHLRNRMEARRRGEVEVPDDEVTPLAGREVAPASDETSTAEPGADADGPRMLPVLLFSGAGAGVVAFGVAATLAMVEDGNLSDRCTDTAPCGDSDVAGLRRRDLTADVSLGLAAGLAVAGLVVTLVGGDDEPSVAVVPLARHGVAGISVGGRF